MMPKDKIKYLGDHFAENIVDSYKSLSNINKHLSQIQTSEIKELKKLDNLDLENYKIFKTKEYF